jgi:protein-tyrosine phosphatase
LDILVVCTGNVARSPMGALLLHTELEARGVAARVHSAGTIPWGGAAVPDAVAVMGERGLDLTPHVSQPLTRPLVAGADLILGMTRAHVWGVVAHDAAAADRTFLFAELPHLGALVGARSPDEALRAWAARVAARRPNEQVPGRAEDEIGDPLNEPIAVYRATATRLGTAARVISALVAAPS